MHTLHLNDAVLGVRIVNYYIIKNNMRFLLYFFSEFVCFVSEMFSSLFIPILFCTKNDGIDYEIQLLGWDYRIISVNIQKKAFCSQSICYICTKITCIIFSVKL